jgi:hypothetical protein
VKNDAKNGVKIGVKIGATTTVARHCGYSAQTNT